MNEKRKVKLEEQSYIHVLVTKELKEELIDEALDKQMPLATYIRMLLVERSKKNKQNT